MVHVIGGTQRDKMIMMARASRGGGRRSGAVAPAGLRDEMSVNSSSRLLVWRGFDAATLLS